MYFISFRIRKNFKRICFPYIMLNELSFTFNINSKQIYYIQPFDEISGFNQGLSFILNMFELWTAVNTL